MRTVTLTIGAGVEIPPFSERVLFRNEEYLWCCVKNSDGTHTVKLFDPRPPHIGWNEND